MYNGEAVKCSKCRGRFGRSGRPVLCNDLCPDCKNKPGPDGLSPLYKAIQQEQRDANRRILQRRYNNG